MAESAHRKAIKAKVPPRAVQVVLHECGSIFVYKTAGEARRGLRRDLCACMNGCGWRRITYRRGSLYGRGKRTWHA